MRYRAEQLYQQLDMLQHLRQQARRALLEESRKHTITAKLRQIPSLGPIRASTTYCRLQFQWNWLRILLGGPMFSLPQASRGKST